jgi:hypothetical protein
MMPEERLPTKGERAWLELLLNGPQRRPRYGAVPMASCIRTKWTEWVYPTRPGSPERITEAGRAVLWRTFREPMP